jgi:signal transduction histidine kinase
MGTVGLVYCGVFHALTSRGHPLSHKMVPFTDPLLVALLCSVSGGLQSDSYAYFYGVTLAVAARFGPQVGMLAAGMSILSTIGLFFLIPASEVTRSSFLLSLLYFVLIAGITGRLAREGKPALQLPADDHPLDNRLLALSRSLASLDLDTVLQRLADELLRQIPCRGACVIFLEHHRRRANRVAASGDLAIPPASELNAALTNGLLHDALEQGTVMLDSSLLIRTRFQSSPQMQTWALQNILIVRLHAQSPVGCLVLTDKRSVGGFVHEDIQLLTAVAEHAALAISKAWEVEQTRNTEADRRGLLRAVIRAQEEERKQVVNEWHERLGTKLFQVIRDFRACQELIHQRVPEGKERFAHLASELDLMAALVRNFTNELHPSVLDDFGFVEALREYVATLQDQEPFQVTLETDTVNSHLPNEAGLTLFRITQEAVRNIRQHAQAKNVQIAFFQEHSGVSLMIKDDGQGFNPAQPLHGHYGLLYMRERAEACGGEFYVHSIRGQGTEIRVDFPTPPHS